MKICDVKQAPKQDFVDFESIEQIKDYVDGPLVAVCEDLFLKNIRTWYSHCNTISAQMEQEKIESFTANLGIDARSLSDDNLAVLRRLMTENPDNVQEFTWHGNEKRFGKGNIPKVNFIYEFPADIDIEVVSQFYKAIGEKFAHQEKITDNGHFTQIMTDNEYYTSHFPKKSFFKSFISYFLKKKTKPANTFHDGFDSDKETL